MARLGQSPRRLNPFDQLSPSLSKRLTCKSLRPQTLFTPLMSSRAQASDLFGRHSTSSMYVPPASSEQRAARPMDGRPLALSAGDVSKMIGSRDTNCVKWNPRIRSCGCATAQVIWLTRWMWLSGVHSRDAQQSLDPP